MPKPSNFRTDGLDLPTPLPTPAITPLSPRALAPRFALLQRHNLQPGKDVKFIYLGGVREVLAAIDRGIVSAGVLSSPT